MPVHSYKSVELALQGGGAHGALTWGALDRLLEDDRLLIKGISGTSAGAMNAVVLADGLEAGGPAEARRRLDAFWFSVGRAAVLSPFRRSWWARMMGSWGLEISPAYVFFDQLSRLLSPYQLNPLRINPLREIVVRHVDFARVNRSRTLRLFVTATNVRSGLPKIFRQPSLSVDSVMASAALPFLFEAVEIDGEAYWDGGYMGNPALFPLVDECAARDLLLIQINPFYRADVPRRSRDIINRLNEITFNASLLKELRAVLLLKQMIDAEALEDERFRDVRLHNIHCDKDLGRLHASAKMNAEWSYLRYLRDLGRRRADEWLAKHWDDLGARSTFHPEGLLEESLRPVGGVGPN
jgi:NTE family protein